MGNHRFEFFRSVSRKQYGAFLQLGSERVFIQNHGLRWAELSSPGIEYGRLDFHAPGIDHRDDQAVGMLPPGKPVVYGALGDNRQCPDGYQGLLRAVT